MPELPRTHTLLIFDIFSAHAMLGVQQNLISYLTGAHVSPKEAALVLAIALGAAAPGKLISGILADRVNARAGMIFIPSKKGISHSPLEWTDPEEICLGSQILLETMVRVAHEES